MADAFNSTADIILTRRLRPWINAQILDFIRARSAARTAGNPIEERCIATWANQSVGFDQASWLNDLVSTGEGGRRLRKQLVKQQGQLRDSTGNQVSSEQRVDTLGKYRQ